MPGPYEPSVVYQDPSDLGNTSAISTDYPTLWSTPIFGGSGDIGITSGSFYRPSAGFKSAYTENVLPADTPITFEIDTPPGVANGLLMYFRTSPVPDPTLGYLVALGTSTTITLNEATDFSAVSSGTIPTPAAGDMVRIFPSGTRLVVDYYDASTSTWSTPINITNSLYQAAGRAGLEIDTGDATVRVGRIFVGEALVCGFPSAESLGRPGKQRSPMPMIIGPREDRRMAMYRRNPPGGQ